LAHDSRGPLKKVKKYFYNTKTLRFEKLEVPLHIKLLRVFGFVSAAIVTALIIVRRKNRCGKTW
jgi:hypothetical protein